MVVHCKYGGLISKAVFFKTQTSLTYIRVFELTLSMALQLHVVLRCHTAHADKPSNYDQLVVILSVQSCILTVNICSEELFIPKNIIEIDIYWATN